MEAVLKIIPKKALLEDTAVEGKLGHGFVQSPLERLRVRNKSMHTEEHFVGFKAMNGFRIEKDTYPVCFYAILGCFLYAHAIIYAVYFLVRYFLISYFPAEY